MHHKRRVQIYHHKEIIPLTVNSSFDAKAMGSQKCKSAHSSSVEFCKGVPVKSKQKSRGTDARSSNRRDLMFLSRWASSTIKAFQLRQAEKMLRYHSKIIAGPTYGTYCIFDNTETSFNTISYVVMSTWNLVICFRFKLRAVDFDVN